MFEEDDVLETSLLRVYELFPGPEHTVTVTYKKWLAIAPFNRFFLPAGVVPLLQWLLVPKGMKDHPLNIAISVLSVVFSFLGIAFLIIAIVRFKRYERAHAAWWKESRERLKENKP